MNEDYYLKNGKLAIFAGFYKKHSKLFLLDMSCAFMMSVIDLVFPLATRYSLNNLLPGGEYRFFYILIASLLGLYALRSLFSYTVTYLGHGMGVLIEADMRQALFSHLQRLSFKFYDRHRTGQLMSRVTNDLFEITELSHHGPEDLFISIVTLAGSFAVLTSIDLRLTLILAVLVPIAIVFTVTQRKRMSRTSRKVKERMAGINADIESSISGARVSKAFGNEDYEVEKFARGNEKFKTSKGDYYMTMAIFTSGLEFFTNIFSVTVLLTGGIFIMKGMMNAVDVFTFMLYVGIFVQPIKKLTQFAEQYTSGMAGFSRFVELMRIRPEIVDRDDAVELVRAKGEIAFRDVSFAYNAETNVLHAIDLTIPAGKTYAFVGPSGGGKTTLCHLLPRFYETTGGQILIDGQDIKSLTLESLRRNIGIVSQDVFLFSGSVYENIRYGRIDATDEEIYAAARAAEIYDTVMEMPEGFDTQVGERGVMLSGGQKQRISIARIFLKNPPILILDEATSALDTVTEMKIQKSFDELSKGRTTLVIAHRLSTVLNADRIVYIDEEGIREQGRHEDLLAANGEYARLYRTQFEKTASAH